MSHILKSVNFTVTKNRGGKGRGRGGGSRKTMADRMKTMDENGNPVEGGSDGKYTYRGDHLNKDVFA